MDCTMMAGKRYFSTVLCLLALLVLVACRDNNGEPLFAEKTMIPPGTGTPAIGAATDQPPVSSGEGSQVIADAPERPLTPQPVLASRNILPAPLYFLSDGQIARLETDGETLTQLTQEQEPITDFDVSPVDAHLIYVSGNRLIEANPQYGQRLVKLDGGPIDLNSPADRSVRHISAPRFSPDGREIVFGFGGLHRMLAGESRDDSVLLASDPYPEPNNPPRGVVRFFTPGDWSPDAARISVEFAYWPEAGGLAIWDMESQTLLELESDDPNASLCCHWTWGRTPTQAFIASNLLAYGVPGLSKVDATTGKVRPLIVGLPPQGPSNVTPARLFRSVFEAKDGALLTFAATIRDAEQRPAYSLQRITQDGEIAVPVRDDAFEHLLDVLWARDGSGAAIAVAGPEDPTAEEGAILWVPASKRPAVAFPVRGSHLRWGPTPDMVLAGVDASMGSGGQTEADDTVDDTPVATALVALNVRQGPGTAYPVIGKLEKNETVRITGRSPDRGWWQIAHPNGADGRGWIIGGPAFVLVRNSDKVGVVAPPALPAPAGRIYFYGTAGLRGRPSVLAQSLEPGATPEAVLQNAIQPSVSPDGRRLAVRSLRSDLLGIGVYDMVDEQLVGLTSHSEDSLPSWNPVGDRLVFASTRNGDRRWRIYTQSATTSETAKEITFGLDPDWHPTQDLIAYKGCDDVGEHCGIWIMDADGRNRRPLTGNATDSRPVWAPDGRTIVFMSEKRDGNWEVYTVDVASGAVTRLTHNPANDGLPVVSPNGGRVAFVSNRGGVWGVWTVPIQGGVAREVVSLGPDLPNWLEQKIDWAPK